MNTPFSQIVERLLSEGMVGVEVLPILSGVVLPTTLMSRSSTVTLRLSHRFGGSVVLDEHGICADLSFQKQPFTVFLPWAAILFVWPWPAEGEKQAILTPNHEAAWPEDVRPVRETVEQEDEPLPSNVIPFKRRS